MLLTGGKRRVHLTRAATLEPIYQFLESGGSAVARRLSRVGIASELLESQEAMIPLRQCCLFVQRTIQRDRIRDFGIEAGSRAAIGEFGLFGQVLRQSLTLKDLLEKLTTWIPLVNSGGRAWLEDEAGTGVVRLCIEHDTDIAKPEVNEYGLMLLIDAVRIAAGPDWRPERVWLNREGRRERQSVARFEALSEATVHFHPRIAAFRIPERLLRIPVRRAATDGRNSPRESERELLTTAPPSDLEGSITTALRARIGAGVPGITELADLANTTPRSIQRGLSARGTSFRELLDRVRFEKATKMLTDRSIHISEIAYRLGYSELSNFTHAFKRWTGTAPSTFRSRAGEKES